MRGGMGEAEPSWGLLDRTAEREALMLDVSSRREPRAAIADSSDGTFAEA
jgi:hypothetical protein